MKEIEKYIGYYLLVYLVVLAICGFFQYMSVCQGKSLLCAVTSQGITDILTVTAYILTPIVAIIGFQSWKTEKQYDLEKAQAEKIIKKVTAINLSINRIFFILKPLENIQNYTVIINQANDLCLDFSSEINLIRIEFDTLNRIVDQKILETSLHNFFQDLDYLRLITENIIEKYLEYYALLNNDLKQKRSTIIEDYDFFKHVKHTSNFSPSSFKINLMKDIYLKVTTKKFHVYLPTQTHSDKSNYMKTYIQYKQEYDLSFNELMDVLVKVIKPHKKTALTDGFKT